MLPLEPMERVEQRVETTSDAAANEKIAVLAHERAHWQAEAERWRSVAHAQRDRIALIESTDMKALVRDLVSALEECRPFVLHADGKWPHARITSAKALLDQAVSRAREFLLR